MKIQVMAKEPTTLNDGLEAARLFEGMLDVEKDNSVSTTNPFRSTREEILSEQVATLTEKLNVMSSNRDNSVGEQLAALNKKIEELSSKYEHIAGSEGRDEHSQTEERNAPKQGRPTWNQGQTQQDWGGPQVERNSDGNKQVRFRDERKCFFCGRIGHVQADCWAYQRQSSNATHSDIPVNRDMSLTGVINGSQVDVLADSGSHLNIMSEKCYRNLKPIPKLLRPDFVNIIGVSGVGTPVMGMAKVKLILGELSFDITCHVMNGPRNDVIIGR